MGSIPFLTNILKPYEFSLSSTQIISLKVLVLFNFSIKQKLFAKFQYQRLNHASLIA